MLRTLVSRPACAPCPEKWAAAIRPQGRSKLSQLELSPEGAQSGRAKHPAMTGGRERSDAMNLGGRVGLSIPAGEPAAEAEEAGGRTEPVRPGSVHKSADVR